MKYEKSLSTIWLDFICYIFIPFYIFSSSLELLKILNSNIILSILLIIINAYFFVTLLFLSKRKKIAYYMLFPFYILSYISISFYLIFKYNLKENIFYILFIVFGIIWIIFNYIYIIKRKNRFYEHSVAHVKKCPGCNRIIPISMKYCGKCNYVEVEDGDIKKS